MGHIPARQLPVRGGGDGVGQVEMPARARSNVASAIGAMRPNPKRSELDVMMQVLLLAGALVLVLALVGVVALVILNRKK